jgi:hypothetical protein
MKVLIKTLVYFVFLASIVISIYFFSTISPPIKGKVTDGSTDIPIQDISVCWERISDIETILDQGCTKTDSLGYYDIPGKYRLFGGSVAKFNIYFNRKLLPTELSNKQDLITPFNFGDDPQPENKKYSTEIFTVSFSKALILYLPYTVDIGLVPKE